MERKMLINILKNMQIRMRTQDHSWHVTSNPIYVVYRNQEIVTTDDYSSNYTYYDHDNLRVIGKNLADLIDEIKEYGWEDDCPLDLDTATEDEVWDWMVEYRDGYIDKHYVETIEMFVDAFLTEQAARDYIERRKHHDRTLHLFVESGCRNIEMQALQDLLLNLDLSSVKWLVKTPEEEGD